MKKRSPELIQALQNPDLRKFDYTPKTRRILFHWINKGGKVHKNKTHRGKPIRAPYETDEIIQELLMDGRNPYAPVVDDMELRVKKWSLSEIKDCISYYTEELKKDISKMYFRDFVYLKYSQSRFKDKSPISETFLIIQKNKPTIENEHLYNSLVKVLKSRIEKNDKDDRKEEFRKIPPLSFIQCSGGLNNILKKYNLNDSHFHLHKDNIIIPFVDFVMEKLNIDTFKLNYIAGDTFIEEFLSVCLARHTLYRKRK